MDPELDSIISILNPRNQKPKTQFKSRAPKPGVYASSRQRFNPLKNRTSSTSFSKLSEKSTIANEDLSPELISNVQQFYEEKDEEYRKTLNEKIGAPVLWLRNRTKKLPKNLNIGGRYLVFRPYIDPMNVRPLPKEDSGYYYKFHNSDVKLIRFTLEDNGFLESNKNNWSIMWHGGVVKSHVYQSLTKYQKINHFPRTHEITRKDLMFKNIARMQALHGSRNFGFIPKTYILPQEAGELEYEMSNYSGLWIVKPTASSQGKGIFIASKFSDIPKRDYVVSQYIEKPLLLDGFKFDLRIYVALTSVHPLRIYMYNEGLVRFATQKYKVSGKGSRYMHLTNYSVNKYSNNFRENTDARDSASGSKWSLSGLINVFNQNGIDSEKILIKIKDIIIKTILSIETAVFSAFEVNVPYRTNCFELLGFDILIDKNLDPWLLEVNLSPSLNCDSPLDQKIKGSLIADLFSLVGVVSLDHRDKKGRENVNKGLGYLPYMQKPPQPQVSKKNKTFYSAATEGSLDSEAKENKRITKETNEEFKRRGGFERIFPSELSVNYKNYFEVERPFNALICNKLGKIHRKGQGAGAVVFRKSRR